MKIFIISRLPWEEAAAPTGATAHSLGTTEVGYFNSIQFIDHLYSPPLSKVHYGRAL